MTTTINADTSTGGAVISGDASGVLGLQAAGSTQVTINGSGVVLANPLPVGSGGTGATSLSGITVGTATNATNATNATTATNLAGGSAGTVPYQSASGTTAMLAAGTSGYVLQSNGAAAPSWVAPAGGGSLILLQTVTGSSVANLDVTGYFTSTYKFYKLYFSCELSSPDQLDLRLYINGTLQTSNNYAITKQYAASGSVNTFAGNSGQYSINTSTSGKNITLEITFYDPSNANHRNAIFFTGSSSADGPDSINVLAWANWMGTGSAGQRAITGVRFLSGTMTTASARLYGIKETS